MKITEKLNSYGYFKVPGGWARNGGPTLKMRVALAAIAMFLSK